MQNSQNTKERLLIKRYASRRFYNTESSDYVTLDDITQLIRDGRDVHIVDLKTGDDLTSQYLLQIIAQHESCGTNMLPINVLNDLIRTYATQAQGIVPQFLAHFFDILRHNQKKILQDFETMSASMPMLPEMEHVKNQQQLFLQSMAKQWGMFHAPLANETSTENTTNRDHETVVAKELESLRKEITDLKLQINKPNKES